MKTISDILNNIISEKLSVDSISEKLSVDSIVLAEEKFPIDGTLEEMMNFLIDHGYKEIPYKTDWNDTLVAFKKANKSSVMVDRCDDNSIEVIEFIDKSNNKFKDTLFIVEDFDDICYYIIDIKSLKTINDKNAFAEMVNNLFK